MVCYQQRFVEKWKQWDFSPEPAEVRQFRQAQARLRALSDFGAEFDR